MFKLKGLIIACFIYVAVSAALFGVSMGISYGFRQLGSSLGDLTHYVFLFVAFSLMAVPSLYSWYEARKNG